MRLKNSWKTKQQGLTTARWILKTNWMSTSNNFSNSITDIRTSSIDFCREWKIIVRFERYRPQKSESTQTCHSKIDRFSKNLDGVRSKKISKSQLINLTQLARALQSKMTRCTGHWPTKLVLSNRVKIGRSNRNSLLRGQDRIHKMTWPRALLTFNTQPSGKVTIFQARCQLV